MRPAPRFLFAALAAWTVAIPPAFAQAYPTRPINVVNPWPPGAVTDMLARLVAEGLRVELGQPVIVENRAGAGGVTGLNVVATSKPDGRTIGFATVGAMAMAPHMMAMPFDRSSQHRTVPKQPRWKSWHKRYDIVVMLFSHTK